LKAGRDLLIERFVSVAFKVYDMDRDGFISNGELFLVLKMMVGNNLKVRLDLFTPFSGFCLLSKTIDSESTRRIHNSRKL
jgi:hypothetical protein